MNRWEETLTQKMVAMAPEMGEHKARQKARNTVRGVYLMTVGTLLLLAGIGILIVPIVILKESPSAWFIAFGALALVLGFYLGMLGANAYSGEVTDAATTQQSADMITAIGTAIGLARGKVPKE
jgi:protein-S-isoprenylcysteine O-methyltransferase Ste14